MQRKTGQKDSKQMIPSTRDIPINTMPYTALLNPLEKAKLAFPIFGGTSPEGGSGGKAGGDDSDKSGKAGTAGKAGTESSTTTSASGGGGGDADSQLADLLEQVATLNQTVQQQAQQIQGYTQKEEQAQRASQTREQNLENDLNSANQTIEQMDAVIQFLAVENAIQGYKDAEWHNPRQVFSELRDGNYDFEVSVDLEGGTASVNGIEKALAQIAKDSHWLVSNRKTEAPNGNQQQNATRSSGQPPGQSTQSGSAAERRAALIDKFPVIGGNRARVSSG